MTEIGPPLRACDLREGTIVVLRAEDRPTAVTLWVELVTAESVVFLAAGAATPTIHFVTFRSADDVLTDDAGRRLHVFEYLGQPERSTH